MLSLSIIKRKKEVAKRPAVDYSHLEHKRKRAERKFYHGKSYGYMVTPQDISIELSAVIVSVAGGQPRVRIGAGPALPSGPFETQHRTLEQGLRAWVHAQSGMELGYVEQLYTFADKDRTTEGRRFVSIGYLALCQTHDEAPEMQSWYDFFPWEDHRTGAPKALMVTLHKHLTRWKNSGATTAIKRARDMRIAVSFPKNPRDWNEELVLQRYELLWEAGLIEEATRGHKKPAPALVPSCAMAHDHRRILATAIARLRAKIKYRPVVFELLPDCFTLLQLQETVEALAGLRLHKQNFRRLVLTQGLVEETTQQTQIARGRPAKLFTFRREVLRERAAAGTKLPRSG